LIFAVQLPAYASAGEATLEMSFDAPEPIIKLAQESPQEPEHGAAIIFLHGLNDDAYPYASTLRNNKIQ
jgi:hypothetical protein